jgi:hypothetical protein
MVPEPLSTFSSRSARAAADDRLGGRADDPAAASQVEAGVTGDDDAGSRKFSARWY